LWSTLMSDFTSRSESSDSAKRSSGSSVDMNALAAGLVLRRWLSTTLAYTSFNPESWIYKSQSSRTTY
jgi:hypothetical protein